MTNQAKPFSGLKPDPKSLGRDIVAGLVAAVAAIPDGMASAVLAGVNPVAGHARLADVSDEVREQLTRTGTLTAVGAEHILPADSRLVGSINAGRAAGEAVLAALAKQGADAA